MSQKKDRRARREAKAAAKAQTKYSGGSSSKAPLWVLLGIVIVSACVGALVFLRSPSLSEAPEIAKAAAGEGTEVVHEYTVDRPEKYVCAFKMFHGGDTSLPRLIDDPEMLADFIEHHDNLLQAQLELLKKFGTKRFRCMAEGTGADDVASMRKLRADAGEAVFATFDRFEDDVKVAVKSIRAGRPDVQKVRNVLAGPMGAKYRHFIVAPYRFARHLAQSKPEDGDGVLLATDIPGEKHLGLQMFERLGALTGQAEMPSDNQLEEFLTWQRDASRDDFIKRHGNIREQLAKLPNNIVCSVVIGGDLSNYGIKSEKTPNPAPLEAVVLADSPQLRWQTFQDRGYAALVTRYHNATGALKLGRDTELPEMRKIIAELRSRQR